MGNNKRKRLLISIEVICLAILLPLLYLGTVKLLLDPIERTFYPHDLYEHLSIPWWAVFVAILTFDAIWIVLMKLCPYGKVHVKVVLTLLVLIISIAILSCFIIINALTKAFA